MVTRKYTVNACGSGWGVWDAEGHKVASMVGTGDVADMSANNRG